MYRPATTLETSAEARSMWRSCLTSTLLKTQGAGHCIRVNSELSLHRERFDSHGNARASCRIHRFELLSTFKRGNASTSRKLHKRWKITPFQCTCSGGHSHVAMSSRHFALHPLRWTIIQFSDHHTCLYVVVKMPNMKRDLPPSEACNCCRSLPEHAFSNANAPGRRALSTSLYTTNNIF